MEDEDDFLNSIGVSPLSEEDAALREMGVSPPADAGEEGTTTIPEGYRDTGRREVTTQLGETTFSPRAAPSFDPSQDRVTELRQVEKDPTRTRTMPQGEDTRGVRERLRAYLSGRDPEALSSGFTGGESSGSFAGMQLPTLASTRRAVTAAGQPGTGASDVLSSLFPQQAGQGVAASMAPAQGVSNALTFGFGDELAGLVRGEGARDNSRRLAARAQEEAPGSVALGSMAATAPLVAAPLEAAPMLGSQALGSMLTAGGLGLGAGTLRGAGESTASDAGGIAEDAVRGGAFEGGLNTLLMGGGEGAGAALGALSRRLPGAATAVRGMADEARIEAANLMPNAAPRSVQGRALARMGGQRGLAEALDAERIGGRVLPTGGSVARDSERLAREAGQGFDDVLAAMDEAVTAGEGGGVSRHEVVRRAEALLAELDALDTVPARQAAERVRDDFLRPWLAGQDEIGWQAAHNLRQHLNEVSGAFRRATDPISTSAASGASDVSGALSDVMDESASVLGPEVASGWNRANRQWQLHKYLQDFSRGTPGRHAASTAEGHAIGNGNIPGAFVARTAAGVVARVRPGLQARSLQALVPALQAMGPRASRWSAILQQASRRGGVALAAAHAVLQRTDPEYRQTVDGLQEEE